LSVRAAIDKPELSMIYIKTELGKTALHDKSLGLTPRQRSSFIMFDGKRTADEILKLTLALGVTAVDISRLVELGLLEPTGGGGTANAPAVVSVQESAPEVQSSEAESSFASTTDQGPTTGDQAQYAKAYPIAVRLTSNLGLRGFRLNLSVESARDLEALKDLAPKIKEAVGIEKFKELENALYR
jgi:hypothetical protein